MDKQKTHLAAIAVLAVLLVGGAVSAYVAENGSLKKAKERTGNMSWIQGGPERMHGIANITDLNLPKNATRMQIREAARKRNTEELGLSLNATDQQIMDALQKTNDAKRARIEAAIESGDYENWTALRAQDPQGNQLISIITKDKFQKYAEMLLDEKKADALAKELGLSGKIKTGCGAEMHMQGKENRNRMKR